ncbi:MAG: hypothetical protein Unbinned6046contig1000_3 [Prokaryotic dsDNA virus sp.]|nr:MAG: hypothetical protein Unbinned6046contig1000_3 [Prokaryotic dsDNA virus sp.]|tara:strand:- start:152 stop:532 length:381 start_codon:yes stop_codon:yes gene_type:complete
MAKLEVTNVRYFQTRRGTGYECTTNVKNVIIWNDGDGGGTWIPPHKPYTIPYHEMKSMELESLIDDYEKRGDKSSDAYDEERLQEKNAELESQVEWSNYFVDYVYKVNRNLYNDACDYAHKEQSHD